MRKFTLSLALAAILPLASQAQRYLGIATSNWSGTNSLYLNPANIADSRHKFTVDLFSVNVGLDNNFTTVNMGELRELIFNADDTSQDLGNLLKFKDQDQYTLSGPNAEIRLPGFMVSINRKHSIALTSRARFMTQVHEIDADLFRSVQDADFEQINTQGAQAKAGLFNITTHGWLEIGLSYAGVAWETDKHQLKAGATVRYLKGAGYYSLVNKNMDIQYYGGTDSVTIRNTDISYGSNNPNFEDLNDLIKGSGTGFGGDIGVVYEFRPKSGDYKYDMDGKTALWDNSKNKYMLRASVAVTDIGSIKYSDNNFTANFTGDGYIRGSEIGDKISNYQEFRDYLTSRGIKADSSTGSTSTKVGLPTALIIGVDYNIWKGFYANLIYMQNIASREKFGNSIYNQVTITPRYDTKIFSVGIPVTYNMLTKSVNAGVGLRVGGFFVGGDNLFLGNRYGTNFYFGAYVPLNKRKPRDSDGDLVSNKKDKCKHEKGVWEMQGCPDPDKDGDGVLDKEDTCPDVAGSKTAKGCPDADMDGVADAEDRCAQEAGEAAMQGCPDRDKDGIADLDDTCPDLAGLAQFKGCPDTDQDGIADNDDQCPTAWGPIANQGCPDTDNDGIADHLDKCPAVVGTANNSGCPEISTEVKKRLAFAATAIQFDLGKATIKKSSNKLLDEIVSILNEYPDYNMIIEGHTDNVGNAAKNLQLSKDRANAVKNYFISKGISADRLIAEGYGDAKPVAPNKTAAGRAKNRRVSMDLKLKN